MCWLVYSTTCEPETPRLSDPEACPAHCRTAQAHRRASILARMRTGARVVSRAQRASQRSPALSSAPSRARAHRARSALRLQHLQLQVGALAQLQRPTVRRLRLSQRLRAPALAHTLPISALAQPPPSPTSRTAAHGGGAPTRHRALGRAGVEDRSGAPASAQASSRASSRAASSAAPPRPPAAASGACTERLQRRTRAGEARRAGAEGGGNSSVKRLAESPRGEGEIELARAREAADERRPERRAVEGGARGGQRGGQCGGAAVRGAGARGGTSAAECIQLGKGQRGGECDRQPRLARGDAQPARGARA